MLACRLSLLLVLSLAARGFSPGTPVLPSHQKPTFPNSNSIRIQVDEELLRGCATSKSLFIIHDALSVKEQKPSLINQHSVVYKFSCPLCDVEYIGLTARHLFHRIEENCRSSSSTCRHLQQDHDTSPRSLDFAKNFAVLRKCQGKMDCLVYKMLPIKKYRPSPDIQSDSKRAKVFT